nr:hypothetical protein Iba_chr14aCG21740 [Ipomoea batatas]
MLGLQPAPLRMTLETLHIEPSASRWGFSYQQGTRRCHHKVMCDEHRQPCCICILETLVMNHL